jgi:hypothetical protein
MSELRLDQLIDDLEGLSNLQNMDALNPIVVRISHPTNRTVAVIACAQKEPSTLILPLNVIWVDFDPLSDNYRKALRRVSKTQDSVEGRDHTWETVETYAEVFAIQVYDDADTALLTTQNPVPAASVNVMGVARLSVEPEVSSNPVAVAEGDPRLSDARAPTAHTHDEIPATQLKTANGIVTIGGSEAPVAGATLVATGSNSAVWRKLTTSDIQS